MEAIGSLWSSYERVGYAIVEGFLTDSQVTKLTSILDEHIEARGRPDPEHDFMAVDDIFEKDVRVQAIFEQQGWPLQCPAHAGEHLALFRDLGVVRAPEKGGKGPWHQDWAVLGTDAVMTVYCGLSGAEGPLLEVVSGSHNLGQLRHVDNVIPDVSRDLLDRRTCVRSTPGSLLLLHPSTIHRIEPNTGEDDERMYLIFLKASE